jgi:glucokinase
VEDSSEGVVLADVGGTNVRFAVLRNGTLGSVAHLTVAGHPLFSDALAAFLANQAERKTIRRGLLGVAGVVEGKRCVLTNNQWLIDADELCARFGFSEIQLVNDFEAIAWSLPHLVSKDLCMLGGYESKPDAPMVVLGPGTGLGMAAFIPRKQGGIVVRSEGGHATLPSGSLREDAVIEKLRQQFGYVSAERALSGLGLSNLYRVLASLEALTVPERSAAEITQAAVAGSCANSRAAVDTFCALLGAVAGNLALTFGAQGGVFIAGGIIPHLRDYLLQSQFRSRFEAKGRMKPYLASIPVYLVLHHDPAFIGLQALAAGRPAVTRATVKAV